MRNRIKPILITLGALLLLWPMVLLIVEIWPAGLPWYLLLAAVSLGLGVTILVYLFVTTRQKEVDIETSVARFTAVDYTALDSQLEEAIKNVELLQNSADRPDTGGLQQRIRELLLNINSSMLPLPTIRFSQTNLENYVERESLLTNLRLNREKIKSLLLKEEKIESEPSLEQKSTVQHSSLQLINRLKTEINNLNARAKLYLFVGTSVTITAGLLLVFFLFIFRNSPEQIIFQPNVSPL